MPTCMFMHLFVIMGNHPSTHPIINPSHLHVHVHACLPHRMTHPPLSPIRLPSAPTYPSTQSPICPTHPSTCLPIKFTHPPRNTLNQVSNPINHPLVCPFIHLPTNTLIQPPIPLNYSPISQPTRPYHLSTCVPISPPTHPNVYPFTHPPTHTHTHILPTNTPVCHFTQAPTQSPPIHPPNHTPGIPLMYPLNDLQYQPNFLC